MCFSRWQQIARSARLKCQLDCEPTAVPEAADETPHGGIVAWPLTGRTTPHRSRLDAVRRVFSGGTAGNQTRSPARTCASAAVILGSAASAWAFPRGFECFLARCLRQLGPFFVESTM